MFPLTKNAHNGHGSDAPPKDCMRSSLFGGAASVPCALIGLLCLGAPAWAQSQPPAPGQLPQQMQLPNTVSAPPFTVADKFDYRLVQSFGLRGFVPPFFSAAIGQARNAPHEWGQGFGAYAERYASSFAGNVSRQAFEFTLEAAFHEDPRYFPSEGQPKKLRLLNALKQVVICKTDAGDPSIAYARLISNFGAAQFVNVWQPKSTGSVPDGVVRGLIGLGADAGYNLMQEFIPFTRPISLRHRH